MAAGGVEVSRSSVAVVVDRTRGFNSRQGGGGGGGRDAERRHQTKRPIEADDDRRWRDGRRGDSQKGPRLVSQRGEAREEYRVQKRRKCSPFASEIEDHKVVRAPLCEKVIITNQFVDVTAATGTISSEDHQGSVLSPEFVSTVSVLPVEAQLDGQHPFDDLEEGQLEDEQQVVQAPNIATSKWATCLESPKDVITDVVKNSRWNRSSLSPESGELLSEGRRSTQSGSGSGRRSVEPTSAHEHSEHELGSRIDIGVGEAECSTSGFTESEIDEPASSEIGLSMLAGSRDVNEYHKLSKINEGTYGVVYKAKDRKTEEIVALKMIKMNMEDEYGFPLTSLREINILLSCNHPSIVNVKEVVVGNGASVFMVMEHLEHDLRGVMDRTKQPFSTSEVKCLMIQLLEGIKYLHSNWIIHRDLKPSNLLLNNSGELKICDFGMARQYGSPIKPYTQLVVTQWYRSPELLLGTKEYSTAVDMWSIGCIMAELLSLKPLFRGKSQNDIDQLQQIFAVLGTPSETNWPGFTSLPGAKAKFRKQPYNLLRKKFPAVSFTGAPILSELGFDLLNRLLNFDPEKRLTVDEALSHGWFDEAPLQKSKEFMPTFASKRN
ncbi:PREDICTED: cyclin-dependent kinase G1 isoform X1 [Camelina sativa]|uniref:cyclin-dependent kinase n=1 Tax=Camelina sativa TaxID=90675 RepID=A0ABM0YN48_CAMSA|nr:PREDICTED: cyclin-dependent kinase G1 isoform X1 [Camelina sativa]XP_010503485.1 PREDICTED: cyclin-dependent kinase G1 isoform X1 [Camelina sativa]XP_010503486.1 PREDICTED: cyclin-dependent kinase G1 isoform X1 [Camelina sativa]XP_010503487.1 PREDICTED: cyclin-dependent kinase G1 isoform X1 [Camelina sativa]XP_019100220.1 PREDICTED: cyclin-dependent kinase G1 isoform X1 [Camelina sativa]